MLFARGAILLSIFFCISVNTATAQTEDVSDRFYFPGSIGLSVPFRNAHTHLNDGLVVNTAVEYRPLYTNAVFFRIEYDALNNNYSSYLTMVPTNIVQGKLSTDFLIGGIGYRHQFGRWDIYGLMEPGLGIHSFERAISTANGVLLNSVTTNAFAIKADAGIEYYIKRHFAAVVDPSYYKLFSHNGFNASHSRFLGLNIGITTTIF
jgi:hypothetical protein